VRVLLGERGQLPWQQPGRMSTSRLAAGAGRRDGSCSGPCSAQLSAAE
jgi:hypothetical protein